MEATLKRTNCAAIAGKTRKAAALCRLCARCAEAPVTDARGGRPARSLHGAYTAFECGRGGETSSADSEGRLRVRPRRGDFERGLGEETSRADSEGRLRGRTTYYLRPTTNDHHRVFPICTGPIQISSKGNAVQPSAHAMQHVTNLLLGKPALYPETATSLPAAGAPVMSLSHLPIPPCRSLGVTLPHERSVAASMCCGADNVRGYALHYQRRCVWSRTITRLVEGSYNKHCESMGVFGSTVRIHITGVEPKQMRDVLRSPDSN